MIEGGSWEQVLGKWKIFDGQTSHRSEDFKGRRLSLVAFTHELATSMEGKLKRESLETTGCVPPPRGIPRRGTFSRGMKWDRDDVHIGRGYEGLAVTSRSRRKCHSSVGSG